MHRLFLAAALLLAPTPLLAQGTPSQGAYGPATVQPGAATTLPEGTRHYHIVTVHWDGFTALTAGPSHPAEAFPTEGLPPGGGMLLRAPNAQGEWSVRTFAFAPAQIVVHQGERLALTFVDVQGVRFRIAIDGLAEPLTISRGQARTVLLTAGRPGRIMFRALDQQPSMTGEILVLPR